MTYSSIQFIGHYAKTGYSPDPITPYLGATSPIVDIQARYKLLKKAITLSYAKADPNPNILKVFMCPEGYFNGGRAGAYPFHHLHRILGLLRQETGKEKYENWVFILGAVGFLPRAGGTTSADASTVTTLPPLSYEIFNVALIQEGGYTSGDGVHEHVVYKEYLSPVDFVLKNPLPHRGAWEEPSNRNVFIDGQERHITPVMGSRDLNGTAVSLNEDSHSAGGGCFFTVGGIAFCLEICLDHSMKRAVRWAQQFRKKIDVHLVMSAGTMLQKESIAAVCGGFAFNVDGERDPGSSFMSRRVCTLARWNFDLDEDETVFEWQTQCNEYHVQMPRYRASRYFLKPETCSLSIYSPVGIQ